MSATSSPAPRPVTIPAKLVKYLRRGVKDELGHSLALYENVIHSSSISPETYTAAASRFDAAKSLFEAIGFTDETLQQDIELDLRTWPRLLVKVLEEQYDAEVRRLQDAEADGVKLPLRNIPALRTLAAELRTKAGAPPRGKQRRSFLERSRAARSRRFRRPGHG